MDTVKDKMRALRTNLDSYEQFQKVEVSSSKKKKNNKRANESTSNATRTQSLLWTTRTPFALLLTLAVLIIQECYENTKRISRICFWNMFFRPTVGGLGRGQPYELAWLWLSSN
jgi:hypothetical protein